MRPVFPARLDWPSIIGLFILNFGVLDVTLTRFLEKHVSGKTRAALNKEVFHGRVLLLKKFANECPEMTARQNDWNALISRMETIRDLRNHLAHSMLINTLSQDGETCAQALFLIREVDDSEPETLPVTFEELLHQGSILADLTGELLQFDAELEAGKDQPEPGKSKVFGSV